MLFKRLHRQFTALCALITMAILSLFSVLYLSVSERTLWENRTLSFQHDFDTLCGSLEQQTAITHSFLLRMEQNSGSLIFLWDNHSPFAFNDLAGHEPYLEQAERLYSDYLALFSSPGYTKVTNGRIISCTGEQIVGITTIFTGQMSGAQKAVSLQQGQGLVFLLLSPGDAYHERILRQRILFLLLSLGGCGALTLFAYLFTGRLLMPVRESQKRQIDFVNGASHELRTPLAVIISAAQARPPHFEETVRSEALRMGRLVDELLLLSRMDAQNLRPEGIPADKRQAIQPDTLLLDAFESLEPLVRDRGKTLRLSLPEKPLPRLKGDPDRLRRLLEILVENALAYTGENGLITLSLESSSAGELLFRVQDNGIGIPRESQDKIFERFYRVDSAHHSREHFGLGLSIAREIMKLHGGSIEVTDAPGGGSIFLCRFPV